jgi:hypothetical protein
MFPVNSINLQRKFTPALPADRRSSRRITQKNVVPKSYDFIEQLHQLPKYQDFAEYWLAYNTRLLGGIAQAK